MGRIMKAAVLFELNEPLKIIDLPVRSPGSGQVLVKMKASSLCHTQLLEISGSNASGPMNPNMLGHEGSGIVEERGPGVKKVKKGDHVILSWIKGSGKNVLPEKYDFNGEKINCGFVTTFNEYALVSENRVTLIPKDIPFREASIIGCAVATGAGAVFNNAKVEEGKNVIVMGVGGVGINMVHASLLSGAKKIIAVDIHDEKLELARKLGATHTINSEKQNIKKMLKDSLGEDQLDYAFDTTGMKEIMELLYDLVSKNSGTVVLAGVPKPLGLKIEIDPFPLYYGRKIRGTGGGETNPDKDFGEFCELFKKGDYKLSDMITHVLPLEKINEGFDLLKEGKSCRIVIEFTG